MFEIWWKAHEFEYLVSAILLGTLLLGVGVWVVAAAIREKRRQRRNLDEAYRKAKKEVR